MTTKVTFRVECDQVLSAGERVGLIIHGEYGRLQEVLLSKTTNNPRLHFTFPVQLTTHDRIEYSYVVLSDAHATVGSHFPLRRRKHGGTPSFLLSSLFPKKNFSQPTSFTSPFLRTLFLVDCSLRS